MSGDIYTVKLRDNDIKRLIKVIRYHIGEYQSINNVFDEDLNFIVDTLVEARGEDLDKPLQRPTEEDHKEAQRRREHSAMMNTLREEAAVSDEASRLLDRIYGVGEGDWISPSTVLDSPQTPEQERLATLARERLGQNSEKRS